MIVETTSIVSRSYWNLLFGPEFRRDQALPGINAMLNYGYTVLRASVARAVIAAGLHPTIGLHHSNEGNALRLTDDLMEPFRPTIDLTVWRLWKSGTQDVNPDSKRALVKSLYLDMRTDSGLTPVMGCTQRLAVSLAQVFMKERSRLDLPLPGPVQFPLVEAADQ